MNLPAGRIPRRLAFWRYRGPPSVMGRQFGITQPHGLAYATCTTGLPDRCCPRKLRDAARRALAACPAWAHNPAAYRDSDRLHLRVDRQLAKDATDVTSYGARGQH